MGIYTLKLDAEQERSCSRSARCAPSPPARPQRGWHVESTRPLLRLLSVLEIHDPLFWSLPLFLEVVSWLHILPRNWIPHIPWLDTHG